MDRSMKNSGYDWIGDIPSEWPVLSAQRGFTEVKKKNADGAVQKALQFKFGTIIPKANFEADSDDYVADTITSYTIVEPGTVMINGLNLNYDFKTQRTALVKEKGVITSAYLALWPDTSKITPEYATYLFKGYEAKMALHNMGSGIRLTLGWKEFKKQPVLFPPIQEQYRIVSFLDRKCAEIDSVIAATQRTIEEYKALKQSIITEAVTKGVRGKRPMKDSGIEWFCEIPEEWATSRVGLHYDIILGKMLCAVQPSEDYTLERYFCAANVHFDGISDCDALKEMWFSEQEKKLYQVKNGDLLVVEGGAGAGGSAIVTGFTGTAFIQNSIMIVRGKKNGDNRYLRYFLEHLVKQGYIEVACNKATIPHFTKDKLATVPYPVVPAEEQEEIANYLDSKCSEIERLIISKQQLLIELESYKKSVIYEYVTGKKEVPACQ